MKDNMLLYITNFLISALGAWMIAKYGHKLGFMDDPNERSSHRVATPKGGGIGVVLAFVLTGLTLNIPTSFWLSATLLSFISYWGDRSEIPAVIRLVFQITASIILLWSVHWDGKNQIIALILMAALTVFIVGTTNLYNFMDGIDGIAGITGVVGFALLAAYAFLSRAPNYLMIMPFCITFCCLGFLPFNIPRAKVFMGDVGSIFLGFTFAGMVVSLAKNIADFMVLTTFLFPFYADEIFTVAKRIKIGENLLKPHRRHLYQLLANECEFPHWKVSAGYGFAQLIIGVSFLLIKNIGTMAVAMAMLFYFTAFSIFTLIIQRKIESRI